MVSQKQRSSIDATLLLQNFIQKQKGKGKKIVSSVFLDLQGCFDRVTPAVLLKILFELKMPLSLRRLVASFLSQRKIRLYFDGLLLEARDVTGSPQGSPLSPILSQIFLRDLYFRAEFRNGFSISSYLQLSYVDDYSATVASNSVAKNTRMLRAITEDLFSQAKEKGMPFNPSKTELIHFTTSHKASSESGILVLPDGSRVKPKKVVRYLGIWFDAALRFTTHVEKRMNSAMTVFQGLARLRNARRGLSFKGFRTLYLACITTIADYGVPVWWKGLGQTVALTAKFQKLQNLLTRRLLGAFSRSPSRALELESGLLPPEIRFEYILRRYGARFLKVLDNHPIKAEVSKVLRDENKTMDDFEPNTTLLRIIARLRTVVPVWTIETPPAEWEAPWSEPIQAEVVITKVDKKKARTAHLALVQELDYTSTKVFYTDGSQGVPPGQKNKTNSAAIVQVHETRPKAVRTWNLGAYVEVADAELFAIQQALQAAIDGEPHTERVFIFSDSQAAIQRLSGWNPLAVKARSLAAQLARQGCKTGISWCPSHVNIPGNELADKLAKKALSKAPSDSWISFSYIKRQIKATTLELWKKQWESSAEIDRTGLGKLYRQISRYSLRFHTKVNFDFQSTWPIYIQLKTGVGPFKRYLYLIGKSDTALCPCGSGAQQTSLHILMHCARFRALRSEYLRKRVQPFNATTLFCTKVGKKALLEFLQASQLERSLAM
jgi:ribonuclease HI